MSIYAELLRDPRWQRMRLEVLNRDHWACRRCDDPFTTLHVHHTFYERGRMPWEYHPDSLLTLCKTCHEAVTLGVSLFPALPEGVASHEEMDLLKIGIELWTVAAREKDEAGLMHAVATMREARAKTVERVRRPYAPEWA